MRGSQLGAANTVLAGPEAEERIDGMIASSQAARLKSRRSSVILAFCAGVACCWMLRIAWAAAEIGGRHRDGAPVSQQMARAGGEQSTDAKSR
jgi:hypothetical protein